MTRKWENGWQGGRFDATASERRHMLTENAKKTPLFGGSEGIGLDPIKGWDRTPGECYDTWDTKVWRLVRHKVISVSTPTWWRGRSRRKTVEFYVSLFENIEGGWTLMSVRAHLPAHLFKFFAQRANKRALRQLGSLIIRLQREWNPDETDLAMDINRDMELAKNRILLRESLKGTGLVMILPPGNTHGSKKIDVCASTADEHGPGVMFAWYAGFDHRGWKNGHTSEAA